MVGLTRLEAPGHRGPGADHIAGLEGAPQDSFGAVLNDHLEIGVDINCRRRLDDFNEKKQQKKTTTASALRQAPFSDR